MDLETILGSIVNTSLRIGDLFVPARITTSFLHKFVDPALIYTNLDYPYEFTKSGSITKVKYRDRYFALISEHQITKGQYSPDDLIVLNPYNRLLCTSGAYYYQKTDEPGAVHQDLLIFEFTEPVKSGDLPSHFWYNIDKNKPFYKKPMPARLICIGYPSEVNNIDFDTPRYDAKAVAVSGTPVRSSLRQRISFVPDDAPIYDPQGMSGGGVFALSVQNFEPHVFFAGLLTNASVERFNFISATRICAALDRILSNDASQIE
jgi:hypothetical protein